MKTKLFLLGLCLVWLTGCGGPGVEPAPQVAKGPRGGEAPTNPGKGGDPAPAGRGGRTPPFIRPGVKFEAWGSNGGALLGTFTVLEVRDNWARVAEDPKDRESTLWMN